MLTDFVRKEYQYHGPIYPPAALIFNAFDLCPFDQASSNDRADPYHGDGQANGLCFSQ